MRTCWRSSVVFPGIRASACSGSDSTQRSSANESSTAARQYNDRRGAFTSSTVVRLRGKWMPPYCAFQTKETLTGRCGVLYGSHRCHDTSPPFATADELVATTAASASATAAGKAPRGTWRVVSPASRTSAATRISTPNATAPVSPRSVAGQPAPPSRTSAATSGRRAATASASTSANPNTAVSTTPRISECTRGSKGVRTS